MDPVTIFTLTTTVAGVSKGLIALIDDARHNDKMLESLEGDLTSFKTVINRVEETLNADDIKRMIGEGDNKVFKAVNGTFKECHEFVQELSDSVRKSRSKRTSMVRFVNAKYRSSDRIALQRRITDSTRNVQVALQVITLQATLRISDRLEKSSSGIVGSIKSLEKELEGLRADISSNHDVSPSSTSSVSVVTAPALPRSIVALETAARDTINQALVVWKDQRRPRQGSVHTVQTERSRDDSVLDQSGVMVLGDNSKRGPKSSTAIGKSIRSPLAEETLDQPILIAVCGMTGSGKSNFISKLAGTDVGIGNGLRSQTDTVNKFQIPFEGRQITLVDTPGFADTSISDTDVLKMIAGFMEESYEQDVLLSGIIYLHQITHNRVEGPSLRNINMFQKLCGDNGLRNVVLATTMWDTASTDKEIERFVEREQELTQDFWDRMIEKGSQVRRYWNDRDTAEQLIRELIQHTPIALDIQSELVDEHKNLADTAAGSYIDEGLEQLHQKYQEDLDEYYKMMQTSTEQARHEAEREYEAILEKMHINEEETRLLHEQRLNEMGQQRDEQARARANDAHAYDKKLKDLQRSFESELKDAAKQSDRQMRTHRKEIEKLQQQQAREQSDLLKQHKLDLDHLQRVSEARSAQEKAELVAQLDDKLARQQFDSDSHAYAQISSLEKEMGRLRAANQDSNNNNNFNSGNTNSRSYHNHLGQSNSGSDGYGGGGGGGSGGSIPPPPPAPQLLRVPKPAKHWIARGEEERLENLRRTRAHEQQLAAYYRKYGR